MKNLEQLTDKEKAFYLAKRAYAARWRKKNADKIKTYQENFYLKQTKKFAIGQTEKGDTNADEKSNTV